MEFRHLRYFTVLAEELHFGRAAQRLSITQPPLSFSIKQLEDQLGVRLFERDRSAVTLTAAGKALLLDARNILERASHAREIAKARIQGRHGWLKVGFSGSMMYAGLPQLMAAYTQRFPEVEVKLTESSRFRQLTALTEARIHAAFVDIARIPAKLSGVLLCDDALLCCLPSSHPLAHRTSVELADLAGDEFVMFSRESESANFDRVSSLCANAGFEPRIGNFAEQWLSVIALVAAGLGVSIVPERLARTGIAGVCFIPIRSALSAPSRGYLVWHPLNVTSELQALINLVTGRGLIEAAPVAAPDRTTRTYASPNLPRTLGS